MLGLTLADVVTWQRAWVERWVPCTVDDDILAGASDRVRDCINPWKLVNGPASAVVASVMRVGLQVLSG